jgi:hypothetical protein
MEREGDRCRNLLSHVKKCVWINFLVSPVGVPNRVRFGLTKSEPSKILLIRVAQSGRLTEETIGNDLDNRSRRRHSKLYVTTIDKLSNATE